MDVRILIFIVSNDITLGFLRTQFFTEIEEINPKFSELDEEQKLVTSSVSPKRPDQLVAI